jgi:outer membrane protein OmpA-like peptidoglycan-associated protein
MRERRAAAVGGAILALSSLLLAPPQASVAQAVENGIRLAGTFSEASLGFPLEEVGGAPRWGGGLRAGLELLGFPGPAWHFDLSALYQAQPVDLNSSLVRLGPELRAGYAFTVGRLLDMDPTLALALAFGLTGRPGGSGDKTVLLNGGFKINLYLGNWSWLSLVPEFSYPIGSSASPSVGLGFGFKQLLAWGRAKPARSVPAPAAPAATIEEAAPGPPISPDPQPPSPDTAIVVGIAATPRLFSPDDDGKDDALSIFPSVDRPQALRSWEIIVSDLSDQRLFSWSGVGAPPSSLTWDGRSSAGELVESAQDYRISLHALDARGRGTGATMMITTDVLVIRLGSRFKIRLPSILFTADSAQLGQKSDETFMNQNSQVLNRLAAIFQRFPDYRITIEGHANLINWGNPALAAIEERDSLGPLSLQRAQTVKKALVRLGILADRIKVAGRGGQDPLVPPSDTVNNWKNRRVEIFLDR